MATLLLKTEPSEFSFADLVSRKVATWDGVANPAALIALRSVRKGDELLIYHTGGEKAVVGLAVAVSDAYADPSRTDLAPDGQPKFAVVDLKAVRAAKSPATLAAMKADVRFKDFALIKQSRLSAMVVPQALDAAIRRMAGL